MKRITITLTEDQIRALKACIGVTISDNIQQYNNPEYVVGSTTQEKVNAEIEAENAFLARLSNKLTAELVK